MKLRIGIDVDDVVANLHEVWAHRLQEKFGKAGDPSEWRQYDFWVDFGLTAEDVYSVLTPDIYDEVKPVDGAIEAVRRIAMLGHNVIFVTSCGSKEMFEAKDMWLYRHGFSKYAYSSIPVGPWTQYQKKHQVPMDWLIDDHIGNFDRFDGYKVLVTRPHNSRLEFIGKRVKGLDEVAGILASISRDFRLLGLATPELLDAAPSDVVTGIEGLIAKEEPDPFAGIERSTNTGWETDLDKGGVKHDAEKLRFDLVPDYPMSRVAEVYTLGASKYDDDNWRKGMSVKRNLAALERHYRKFKSGEDIDPNDGTHHLAAVVFNALTILEMQVTHPKLDDRPSKKGYSVAQPLDSITNWVKNAIQTHQAKKQGDLR